MKGAWNHEPKKQLFVYKEQVAYQGLWLSNGPLTVCCLVLVGPLLLSLF